jgi:hypothetical protein
MALRERGVLVDLRGKIEIWENGLWLRECLRVLGMVGE